jgi:AcrR family transcriptional regulator
MPRNRRPQDREEKRGEIVVAAAALFTEVGYDDTSMTKVASAAGIATNTIYWYFTDKDALLVSVLDHVLANALSESAAQLERPWAEQVLWAIDRLEQYGRLVTTVHARTAASAAIDTWHVDFHDLMDTLMAEGLRRAGVPEAEIRIRTRMGIFVVEGLLMHPHTAPDRSAIVELLTSTPSRSTG